jgi:hypothetical protein
MNNTYFNLPTYNYNETYAFSDIFATTKTKKLADSFLSDNEAAWYYIIANDNTLLEQISYTEYGRSDYWDVLMIINQMDTPCNLPKSQEYVSNEVEAQYDEWLVKFPNYPQSLREEKLAEIYSKVDEVNEKHRTFRCIKDNYIPLIVEALRER